MSEPLARFFDLPIKYPTQGFGQHQEMLFLIEEVNGKLTMGVNSNWSGYETLNRFLDYLTTSLKAANLLPEIDEFSVSELFGKLVIDLSEYGTKLALAWPSLVLITGLVLKLKERICELSTGSTPLPSNIEEKRNDSSS